MSEGYNPADHFTVKGWEELGKIIATGKDIS
jgi:hypothetical protein